ncbi:MAG: hypothetical protein Q9219_005771 [cf. Caloplaca sp. 3 TL-2023]
MSNLSDRLTVGISDADLTLQPIWERLQQLEVAFSSLLLYRKNSVLAKHENFSSMLEKLEIKWIDCYDPIEKVLVALLAFLNIKVDSSRDANGKHSHHLNVLEAFDRQDNELRDFFQFEKGRESARTVINELRISRNSYIAAKREHGDCRPSITKSTSFVRWCLTIMKALFTAFIRCVRQQQAAVACITISDPITIVFCMLGKCKERFPDEQLWQGHTTQAHPEILKLMHGVVTERVKSILSYENYNKIQDAGKDSDGKNDNTQKPSTTDYDPRATQLAISGAIMNTGIFRTLMADTVRQGITRMNAGTICGYLFYTEDR